MNPLEGLSCYDTLNRLIIGFLASLWILFLPFPIVKQLEMAHYAAFYIVGCYVVGFFFSLIVDRITECKSLGILNIIFYKNDMKRIDPIASKFGIDIIPSEKKNEIPNYWIIYYTVQRNCLLGNVTALESLSAFMLNLCSISIVYLIGSLITIAITQNCCQLIWIPIVSAFMSIFCAVARYYLESKIYVNVLAAYKYLNEQKYNNNNL